MKLNEKKNIQNSLVLAQNSLSMILSLCIHPCVYLGARSNTAFFAWSLHSNRNMMTPQCHLECYCVIGLTVKQATRKTQHWLVSEIDGKVQRSAVFRTPVSFWGRGYVMWAKVWIIWRGLSHEYLKITIPRWVSSISAGHYYWLGMGSTYIVWRSPEKRYSRVGQCGSDILDN